MTKLHQPSKSQKTIWLIRHPATDWNEEGRFQGRSNRPLSQSGLNDARLIAAAFRFYEGFDELRYSPRSHCEELATLLAKSGAAKLIRSDERLVEIDHGAFEGLTYEEAQSRFPGSHERRWASPWDYRGESLEPLSEADARYTLVFEELLSEHTPQRILLVTHKTPIQLFLTRASGESRETFSNLSIATASISAISRSEGLLRVDFINLRPEELPNAERDTREPGSI